MNFYFSKLFIVFLHILQLVILFVACRYTNRYISLSLSVCVWAMGICGLDFMYIWHVEMYRYWVYVRLENFKDFIFLRAFWFIIVEYVLNYILCSCVVRYGTTKQHCWRQTNCGQEESKRLEDKITQNKGCFFFFIIKGVEWETYIYSNNVLRIWCVISRCWNKPILWFDKWISFG